MEELLDLVGAMRSLASMRVRAAMHALEDVHRYAAAMAEAVRSALLLLEQRPSTPRERGRSGSGRALVLYMSEHGFIGGFNQRLLQAVTAEGTGNESLLVLGSRGAALAAEHGRSVHWQHPMPTRLASIAPVVRQTEAQIYALITGRQVTGAEVIYTCVQHSGAGTIRRRQLFPLELPLPTAAAPLLPPLHNLAPSELLEQLTHEYILAQLTEAAAESLASENTARLTTMNAAHDNVTRRIEQLRQQASQARQEEITSELLDLMTGELAVRDTANL